MVEQVRSKWCDDLENLLECPICFKRPDKWIYQCVQGHHVCQICKQQLPRCPTCTQNWSPTRNLLAEHLCTVLDEIKISLIDPEHEVNKLLVPETTSTRAQTDITGEDGAALPPMNNVRSLVERPAIQPKKAADAHSGSYPCLISSCKTQRIYDALLKHLIVDHSEKFLEFSSKQSIFEHTLSFPCEPGMNFDRAFLITDMGAFFLKITTDVFGNLTAVILIIHNAFVAKHFTYQIEVNCCPDHAGAMHTDEVFSCRHHPKSISDKSLYVARSEIARMLMCNANPGSDLNCTVLLGKKPVVPDDNATEIKKKPYKKKFQK